MKELEIKEILKGLLAIHDDISEPLCFHMLGEEFILLPGVFRPDITEATLFQVENTEGGGTDVVWEIGCGSGVQAVLLAKSVSRVVATDINSMSVENARLNVEKHGLRNVDVRQGDLFEPIRKDEVFDLIIFNPPFFIGRVTSMLEKAWSQDGNLWLKFFREVKKHIQNDSRIEICFSSFADLDSLIKPSQEQGFEHSIIAEKDILVLDKYREKLLLMRFSLEPN